jgi:excisionase family DNA binding protein
MDYSKHVQPVLITVKEAAAILDCSTDTVLRNVHAGRIAHIRIGRLIRVDKSALLARIKPTRYA